MTIEILANIHNWNLPTICPVCKNQLILSKNHKQLSCSNAFCQSRSAGTISKWCETLKIKEMGLTTIENIQDLGYFMTISSIYEQVNDPEINNTLNNEFGKVWSNIKLQIQTHLECSLAQFISGYNIPGVGEKQIQKIINNFNFTEIKDFFTDTNPNRFMCEGIGEVISTKLHEGLLKNKNDMFITIKHITILKAKVISNNTKFAGKTFCFTGSMEYPRKQLQEYVINAGGINLDAVNKKLDYLVMADPNSNSSKTIKARTLGINIITPNEFLEMLELQK